MLRAKKCCRRRMLLTKSTAWSGRNKMHEPLPKSWQKQQRATSNKHQLGSASIEGAFHPQQSFDMLTAPLRRSCLAASRVPVRAFSTGNRLLTTDNPIPANDPVKRNPPSPVSATNEMPLSSEGNMDQALQESVKDGEERRVMQAPNRKAVWSRSQQPREKAMVGPRFEQMIMLDQVSCTRQHT